MKKLVLFVTMISLMFTFSVVASADEADKTYGEVLFDLGLIQGSGNGLNESGYLTRAEMITIINRLDTSDSSSFKLPEKPTFSDVPASNWAFKEVEKAYFNGVTTGLGNGKFGLNDKVTHQQAVTFLLRAIGYEVNYTTAIEDGSNLGIMLYADRAPSDALYRSDIFELMAATLTAYPEGAEEMLIEQLPIDEAKVEDFSYNYYYAFNPMAQAFDYFWPEAYKGTDATLKTASDKEQAIAAESEKIVKLYLGRGQEVSYESFFNSAKPKDVISFNYDIAYYVNDEEYGEYGVYGSSSGTFNAKGELSIDVEATEGRANVKASNPYVEKYGTAKVDGRSVQLYYVEMESVEYEVGIDYVQFFVLVDSEGVYKMYGSTEYGDGVYTRK